MATLQPVTSMRVGYSTFSKKGTYR